MNTHQDTMLSGMKHAIITVAAGTGMLICAGVSSASSLLADAQVINEGSGVTVGLVIMSLGAVGTGAWRLAMWVAKESDHSRQQDEQIAQLEREIKSMSDRK